MQIIFTHNCVLRATFFYVNAINKHKKEILTVIGVKENLI